MYHRFFESFISYCQCAFDFTTLMADRYEVTFIRAWRIVDTMAQVMMEEHFELFFVARCCIIKVLNWFISEEDGEHGAYSLHYNRHIVLCGQTFKASQRAIVVSSTCLNTVGSRCKIESVARPEVTAIGLPLNVPAW